MVIPAMDLIDNELTTASLDTSKDLALRVSIGIAKKTANRYYTKTDESDLYRTAMNPKRKLEYFADNDWPSDWIKTAKGIVRDLFDDKYQFEVEEIKSVEPSEAARTSDNMFDNAKQLYSRKRMQLRDELDRYLNSDVKDVDNVIQWWVDHRQQYPSLSRMAFDYLMIPGLAV
ncbi:hypothetical protein C0991_007681 [Blastosporella zonata]|nr:hypothetical protein C0991_007681 [Blastosporella zonata]